MGVISAKGIPPLK